MVSTAKFICIFVLMSFCAWLFLMGAGPILIKYAVPPQVKIERVTVKPNLAVEIGSIALRSDLNSSTPSAQTPFAARAVTVRPRLTGFGLNLSVTAGRIELENEFSLIEANIDYTSDFMGILKGGRLSANFSALSLENRTTFATDVAVLLDIAEGGRVVRDIKTSADFPWGVTDRQPVSCTLTSDELQATAAIIDLAFDFDLVCTPRGAEPLQQNEILIASGIYDQANVIFGVQKFLPDRRFGEIVIEEITLTLDRDNVLSQGVLAVPLVLSGASNKPQTFTLDRADGVLKLGQDRFRTELNLENLILKVAGREFAQVPTASLLLEHFSTLEKQNSGGVKINAANETVKKFDVAASWGEVPVNPSPDTGFTIKINVDLPNSAAVGAYTCPRDGCSDELILSNLDMQYSENFLADLLSTKFFNPMSVMRMVQQAR